MPVFHSPRRTSSVSIAKERLKSVLTSDRVHCKPNVTDKLESDLYQTVTKYIEANPNQIKITVTRSDIHISFTGEKH
ncbi:MAG: cell division topological specificity factor MinE [Hespellia sp.]|nr:cell division topological specificity factor MinE [Hespellia sp.]